MILSLKDLVSQDSMKMSEKEIYDALVSCGYIDPSKLTKKDIKDLTREPEDKKHDQ